MEQEAATRAPTVQTRSRRAFWVRQTVLWHWVSSAVCLGSMVLFTATGITLNHAAEISATPRVSKASAQLPGDLQGLLRQGPSTGRRVLPPALADWIERNCHEAARNEPAEWSETEIYVSLPRPGGDGWITLDRETGEVAWERTDRGWIAYINDLHKGRHTGRAWQIFIDVIAVAFLVFSATGAVLLQLHAGKRPSTWPAVAFGLAVPLVLAMFFLHR